ncbi:monovalent cation/H+ antiporter subunit A [Paracoccus caeni]|uniref:Monovalent cation/H+ antiporter subunit A n=1 Tax=Paracoccus caeni TaxID=657651 RepID=A0A934SIM1_9RHOB|nr:monovalent cation/H+ antiporter subunit A [Paracoccus caeni]MBK4216037.1 monovalent cation/H+ antiporter subunit A [Paracoccus caeni]
MAEQNLLSILAFLPFVASLALLSLSHNAHRAAAWVSGLTLAAGVAILLGFRQTIATHGSLRGNIEWVPSLGLDITLRLDGFSWLFTLLVLCIGILVVIYARYYMEGQDRMPRFFALLLAFTGAMQGILISGNILIMVVFWELTSIISFLLIGFWHQSGAARDGARTALMITALGGLCLLVAMLIVGNIVGSYDLETVLASGDLIRQSDLYGAALTLFLLGAFTKSAQFPFHFWLPGAMAAPTPVSAYLHSATMVKAGVFLLVRFSPAFGGTEAWFYAVAGTGMITMIVGAVIALFRHDLKGLLAYSTISHLGLITALAGIGGPMAIFAAIFHICNHAIFKASLFMTAGIIDHETGTRDMRKLSGLIRVMPITSVLAITAAASMAGMPLLNGFLSKEMFFAEAVDWHNGTWLDNALPYLAVIGSTFSVAYSLRFIVTVFFGPTATDLPQTPHEPTPWMRRPVEMLVLLCVVIGILPALTLEPILNVAAQAVLGPNTPEAHIAIWHGVNAPLLLSVVAIVVGTFIFLTTARTVPNGPEGPPLFHMIRAQKIYDWLQLQISWRWPRSVFRRIGTEELQPQLRILVMASVLFATAALWRNLHFAQDLRLNTPSPAFGLMWLVGAACAIGAAWQAKYHRFAALVLLGGAGLITCLTFVWFAAPDLAVTQLLVEVVTTVLLLLGLRWLPKRREEIVEDTLRPAKIRRFRDLVIAVIGGSGIAVIAYALMTRPLVPNVGDWFLGNAYYEGGGTNVVNVILVDFRAFDTFGEIGVLAIVGLTVYGLLRRFRPSAESVEQPEQQKITTQEHLTDYLYVPSVIMLWMFPLLIMVSAYFFFRGHDLPGGGFAAGVTMAIAFLLQYLATNVRWVEARITVLPIRWMGFGLLMAAGTGIGAWIFGYPFLTAYAQYVNLPVIGQVPAATAMLFDVGVFALVMGATVLMLIAIAHQSLRASRLREQDEEDRAAKAKKAALAEEGAKAGMKETA